VCCPDIPVQCTVIIYSIKLTNNNNSEKKMWHMKCFFLTTDNYVNLTETVEHFIILSTVIHLYIPLVAVQLLSSLLVCLHLMYMLNRIYIYIYIFMS
jgi:hypothetical protein